MKILGAALALAALVAGLYFWTGKDAAGPVAETKRLKVEKGDIVQTVSAIGDIKPLRQIELKCKASGQVLKFPKLEGEEVKEGEVIAELDPKVEKRNVEREESGLSAAKARLALVKLEHDQAIKQGESAVAAAGEEEKARLEDLARVEKLDRTLVTDAELTSGRLNARLAEERHKQAQASLALVRDRKIADENLAAAEVRRAELALLDATERHADTQIKSPIKGILLKKLVEEGQIVSSGLTASSGGTPVAIVGDISALVVEANVDETDIGKVAVGQSVFVSVEAHPNKKVRGRIDHIPPRGDLDSSIIVFKVKIGLPGSEFGLLRIGMTASVTITTVEKRGVLMLPSEAIRTENRKRVVTAPDQKKIEVVTGIDDGTRTEIVSGLKEGDEVTITVQAQIPGSPGGRPRAPRF